MADYGHDDHAKPAKGGGKGGEFGKFVQTNVSPKWWIVVAVVVITAIYFHNHGAPWEWTSFPPE